MGAAEGVSRLEDFREGFVGGEGVPVVRGVGVVGLLGVVGGVSGVVEIGTVGRVVDKVEVARQDGMSVGVYVFEGASEFFALGSRVVDVGEADSQDCKVFMFVGGEEKARGAARRRSPGWGEG